MGTEFVSGNTQITSGVRIRALTIFHYHNGDIDSALPESSPDMVHELEVGLGGRGDVSSSYFPWRYTCWVESEYKQVQKYSVTVISVLAVTKSHTLTHHANTR